MAVSAIILQIDVLPGSTADLNVNVWYGIVDNVANKSVSRSANLTVPLAQLNTFKASAVAAVIDDAALDGYTLTSASVRYPVYEPGDSKYAMMVAAWTKDITKTNIPTTRTNIYIGNSGEGQLVDFANYTQYRFVVGANKVGTGNITTSLNVVGTETDSVSVTYTGAAGEFTSDSTWTALPAWATGEKILKPMAFSTVATDDPIFRNITLYLK